MRRSSWRTEHTRCKRGWRRPARTRRRSRPRAPGRVARSPSARTRTSARLFPWRRRRRRGRGRGRRPDCAAAPPPRRSQTAGTRRAQRCARPSPASLPTSRQPPQRRPMRHPPPPRRPSPLCRPLAKVRRPRQGAALTQTAAESDAAVDATVSTAARPHHYCRCHHHHHHHHQSQS